MPLVEEDGSLMTDLGQLNFRDRLLREGRVVAIVSDEAIFDLVAEGHRPLANAYAEYAGTHWVIPTTCVQVTPELRSR